MTPRRLNREESRARTREQLLEGAAAVFAERGFYGASVEEIAERSGYTRGAFYSNFVDKDDVLLALIDRRLAQGVEEVSEIFRSSASQAELVERLRERAARHGIDETWLLLQTEFELYVIRNPAARSKLAKRYREERNALARAADYEFKQAGVKLP